MTTRVMTLRTKVRVALRWSGEVARLCRHSLKKHAVDLSTVSKRKPKKRAKTEKAATPTAKKPVAGNGRTRKRGKLNALPDMPLDILEEVGSSQKSFSSSH